MKLSRTFHYFKYFRSFLEPGLDLIFPPSCEVCQDERGPFSLPTLCEPCLSNLMELRRPEHSESFTALSAGVYRDSLKRLLLRAKLHGDSAPLPILAKLLIETYARLPVDPPDLVTYIPPRPDHLRKRGIHLPAEMARRFSRTFELPLNRRVLKWTHETSPQMSLRGADRRKNLLGAFAASPDMKGRRVLVIDDVFTTGGTAAAAAQALGEAGAASVIFLTLAFAELSFADA